MPEILLFVLAGLAIFFGGLLKGAVGMGAPLVSVPVLAAIYGVRTAIAVMTVPLIVSNLWQIWTYRRSMEGRNTLLLLLAGCIVGVVLGTFLLGIAPDAWLAVVLAGLLFAYLVFALSRPEFALSAQRARRLAAPMGLVTGILQGAAGISTPVSVTFIHAQRLTREAHIFAVSAVFMVLSATQILALAAIGVMTWRLAAASTAALAPIMAGVWIGQFLGERVSRRTFERLTYAVLAMIAIGLLAKALPEILG
jgi:uncharacterized membrane protein YfcA